MSPDELAILKANIELAYLDDGLNGADLGFLNSMVERLNRHGVRTYISEKQRYWLDDIFARSGVHRNARRLP
jgi:hypothetical protein